MVAVCFSAAVLDYDKEASDVLHGQYRQDKRALRGVRVSASGERDESWQADANLEDTDKNKSITLSTLPRGYWATLFNLEVVKARNRPIEPPKKPEAAPFFLTTIHKGGQVEPSFPEAGTTAALEAVSKAKREDIKGSITEEEVPDLPSAGGDTWSDEEQEDHSHSGEERDDHSHNGEKQGGHSHSGEERGEVSAGSKRKLGIEGGGLRRPPKNPSKILKQIKSAARFRGGAPSRCKLAELLIECDKKSEDLMDDERGTRFEAVMVYLKTLSPPMVDVDMSSLCQGEWDGEGVHLVELAMQFLLGELRCVSFSLQLQSLGEKYQITLNQSKRLLRGSSYPKGLLSIV